MIVNLDNASESTRTELVDYTYNHDHPSCGICRELSGVVQIVELEFRQEVYAGVRASTLHFDSRAAIQTQNKSSENVKFV